MKYSIGVDIGGMSVKLGLVDENGNIVKKISFKSTSKPDDVIKNLAQHIKILLEEFNLLEKDINGIGVGCPGAISGETGIVDVLPNLGWIKVPLSSELKKYFNTKIRLSNDANVAVLAEKMYGCAKGFDNCIMFTLGTGVGGGIIINGKLYEGKDCKGAEIGHATLVLDGAPCTCGRNGCIETYVSATALINQTKAAMLSDRESDMWKFVADDINNVDGRTAFACAKSGDATAERVVYNYIKYLSESLMSMMNIFRPDVIILGGGICGEKDYLVGRIEEYCAKFNFGYKNAPKPLIRIATLGNDAGIIGAAALVNE